MYPNAAALVRAFDIEQRILIGSVFHDRQTPDALVCSARSCLQAVGSAHLLGGVLDPQGTLCAKVFRLMTHYTPADLEMAERHIVEGAQRIVRQEQILASLQLKGLASPQAEQLLRLFNETQCACRDHRDAIAAALEAHRPSDSPRLVFRSE